MASFLRNTFDNIVNNINSSLSNQNNTPPTRPNRHMPCNSQPTSTPSPGNCPHRPENSRPTNNSASDYIRIIRRNLAPFGGTNTRSNEQASRSSSQPPTARNNTRTQHEPYCPRYHQHNHQDQRHHHHHQHPNQQQQQPQRESDNNMFNRNQVPANVVTAAEKLDISDVRDPSDINNLTAKQLKIILTRNCVDYKGIFEKEVLREKVLQLWIDCNEKKSGNSAQNTGNDGSQQNSDDIDESQACKICMEREINCVLLECGHMLTCVTCGRKLAECPVCRQNVSRCVRTFRG